MTSEREDNKKRIADAIAISLRPDNVERNEKARALAQEQLNKWWLEMREVDKQLRQIKRSV